MSPFVDYNRAEDMEQDTFRITAALVYECLRSLKEKNIEELERNITCAFLLVAPRVKPVKGRDLRAELRQRINDLRLKVYAPTAQDTRTRTLIIDEEELLLGDILDELDKAGILYRLRSSLDSMVTRT